MLLKKFFILLLLAFALESVYSAGTTYTETNGVGWSYERWKTTDATYLELTDTFIYSGGPFYPTGYASYPVQPGYALLFLFASDTEDYIFKKAGTDLSVVGDSTASFSFTKYTAAELSSSLSCDISVTLADISSNMLPLQAAGNDVLYGGLQVHLDPSNPIEPLLEKYYYMKSFVYLEAKKNATVSHFYYPENVERDMHNDPLTYSYMGNTLNQFTPGFSPYRAYEEISDELNSSEIPYMLLKPSTITADFNLTNIEKELSEKCIAGERKCLTSI